jgi:hypothetical protein
VAYELRWHAPSSAVGILGDVVLKAWDIRPLFLDGPVFRNGQVEVGGKIERGALGGSLLSSGGNNR